MRTNIFTARNAVFEWGSLFHFSMTLATPYPPSLMGTFAPFPTTPIAHHLGMETGNGAELALFSPFLGLTFLLTVPSYGIYRNRESSHSTRPISITSLTGIRCWESKDYHHWQIIR